jgi:hypothetical protein
LPGAVRDKRQTLLCVIVGKKESEILAFLFFPAQPLDELLSCQPGRLSRSPFTLTALLDSVFVVRLVNPS